MSEHALSEQAKNGLAEELAALRKRRDELTSIANQRDDVGDSVDDAARLERADDLTRVEDRIATLTDMLDGRPQSDEDEEEDKLPDGTRVTLRFPDGDEQTLRVVKLAAAIPDGEEETTLTADSPLGLALAGHGEGEHISYETPGGRSEAELVSLRLPDAA